MERISLNSHELFGRYTDPQFCLSKKADFDACWEWPEDLGFGYMGTIQLRPGLFLRIGRYKVMKGLSISFDPFNSHINILFHVKGSVFYEFHSREKRNDFLFDSGHFFISYLPGWNGKALYNPETSVEVVGICLSPELFETLSGHSFNQMPGCFKAIMENKKKQNAYHHNSSFKNEFAFLLKEILYCPYKGWMKRIFLEGKTLELFAMAMFHLFSSDEKRKAQKQIRSASGEMEKMYEVKKTIEDNFRNPPGLAALSRQVGISHPKLNFCFKAIYGKTVFEYLREIRLKNARLLLDEGKMSITEISYETGFSNPSHFSRSFKSCYGYNPGDYLRRNP
jgi:AraC-like DNA-binding protein